MLGTSLIYKYIKQGKQAPKQSREKQKPGIPFHADTGGSGSW